MAEYSELEAALNRLCQENCGHDFVEGKCHNCYIGSFLTYIPAADVSPVVHGRWIFKWDSEKDPRRLFVRIVCSKCNLHTGQKSKYCPNCGARMRGAEDE